MPTLAPPACTRLLAARKPLQNLLSRCCSAEELPTILAASEDLLAMCNKYLEQSLSRMSVDNTALAACAAGEEARYGAVACPDLTRVLRDIVAADLRDDAKGAPECQAAYKGAGAMGASCGSPIECQDGLSCAGYVIDPASGDVVTQGACRAPAAVGKSCGPAQADATLTAKALFGGDHQDCVVGARCERGMCVVRETLGRACLQDGDCIEGTHCQASVCANKPRSAEGGACSRGLECVEASPALFCEIAAGASTGTCRQTKVAGASCKDSGCSGACKSEVCVSVCGSR